MLDKRGATYTDGEVGTKQQAVATLEKVIRGDGAEDTDTGEVITGTISRQRFRTPQQKAKRWAELMVELSELEVEQQGEKRQRKADDADEVVLIPGWGGERQQRKRGNAQRKFSCGRRRTRSSLRMEDDGSHS